MAVPSLADLHLRPLASLSHILHADTCGTGGCINLQTSSTNCVSACQLASRCLPCPHQLTGNRPSAFPGCCDWCIKAAQAHARLNRHPTCHNALQGYCGSKCPTNGGFCSGGSCQCDPNGESAPFREWRGMSPPYPTPPHPGHLPPRVHAEHESAGCACKALSLPLPPLYPCSYC